MGLGVILVGDLLLVEVLQDFPDERKAEAARRTLEGFTVEPMVGYDAPKNSCRLPVNQSSIRPDPERIALIQGIIGLPETVQVRPSPPLCR
jgi:hypothetical protein